MERTKAPGIPSMTYSIDEPSRAPPLIGEEAALGCSPLKLSLPPEAREGRTEGCGVKDDRDWGWDEREKGKGYRDREGKMEGKGRKGKADQWREQELGEKENPHRNGADRPEPPKMQAHSRRDLVCGWRARYAQARSR